MPGGRLHEASLLAPRNDDGKGRHLKAL